MSVVHEYIILTKGRGHISFEQFKAFFQQAGLEIVMQSSGLTCGTCHGDGKIVRPDHRGCIVLESDMLPCPEQCDNGRPTDDARRAAIRAGDV